jgi:hypothetical protein
MKSVSRRDRLLELGEVERRLKPFGRRYLGIREIPLGALVGTDGRVGAFTRDFRPLHAFSRERMRSLESAFQSIASASTASTETHRRATSSSSSTATGATPSPRPAARTSRRRSSR